MSRRLDIELTSKRDDGDWTWRAAGAKQPRGTVSAGLVGTATVGTVLKVEVDSDLDGIVVLSVIRDRDRLATAQTLEVLGSGREIPDIATKLASKGPRDRRERSGRGPRGDGDRRPRADAGDRSDRPPRRDRPAGDRPERSSRQDRPARPERPRGTDRPRSTDRPAARRERPTRPDRPRAPVEPRPRTKRLRAGRTHRRQYVNQLAVELRPLADVLLRGGVPGLRQAVDRMNELAATEGRAALPIAPLVQLSERLLPGLKSAEWRDRAAAALAGIDELDLRDLRSVVVAADSQARDDEAREIAQRLREGLTARVDAEHRSWLNEIAGLVSDGRAVRALRLSSRPPKAGAPLPPDLTERLTSAANEALSADVTPDRWATVLDAVAFSPVRQHVKPSGLPATRSPELDGTLRKLGDRVPTIAALFSPTPPPPPVAET